MDGLLACDGSNMSEGFVLPTQLSVSVVLDRIASFSASDISVAVINWTEEITVTTGALLDLAFMLIWAESRKLFLL
jgi:hypothetical protein